MAINTQSLTTYVDEQRLPLLRNAVLGARSAYHFYLMTGVKGATALNQLTTNVSFGDGSACGWNEAGTSTLSQRTLVPGAIKVNMSFCDKQLLKTWMNYEVRVAAGQKTLPECPNTVLLLCGQTAATDHTDPRPGSIPSADRAECHRRPDFCPSYFPGRCRHLHRGSA